MDLQEQLNQDMKEALRAKQALRLETIRLVRAAVKNAEIDRHRALEDSEVLELIAREVKQREEVLETFRAAGRADLVEKTEAELQVLKGYLPAALGPEQLEALAREVIAEVGASSPRDMGRVMKEIMPRVRGKADGKAVNETVRRLLEETAQ